MAKSIRERLMEGDPNPEAAERFFALRDSGYRGPIDQVLRWLASGSLPATIVGVVLAMALVLMSPVLIPVVWAIALAVRAYHGLRDWYEVRRIKKAVS